MVELKIRQPVQIAALQLAQSPPNGRTPEQLYVELSAPITVHVEVEDDCHRSCGHCYNHFRDHVNEPFFKPLVLARDGSCGTQHRSMSVEDGIRVVDILADACIARITITGGECLLNWKTTLAMVQRCRERNVVAGMNSTLEALTKKRAKALREAELRGILTSLMGPNAEIHDAIAHDKGSFERTLRGIRVAQEAGIRISANMVTQQANVAYVYETGKLCHELGIGFSATKAGCAGNNHDPSDMSLSLNQFRQSMRDLVRVQREFGLRVDALEGYCRCSMGDLEEFGQFTKRGCSAGKTNMTIATDGSVRACSRFDVSDGNIFVDGLEKAWANMNYWRTDELIPNGCKHCPLFKRGDCSGGCRMESKMRSGGLGCPDPYRTPDDVPEALASLDRYRANQPPAPNIRRFKIGNFKTRPEEFGGVLIVGSNARILNHDGMAVVKQMRPGTEYAVDDPRITWGDVESLDFAQGLVAANLAAIIEAA